MTRNEGRVAIVTGASAGIGRESALALAGSGFTVYGAARRAQRLSELAGRGVLPLALDVTDEVSSSAAVTRVIAEAGRVDVLVNNAGYGSYGALEEVPLTEARAQLDVNVLGLARMVQLVLPHMRAAGRGRIINISSMGGRFATPLGSWYHASKYAVEGLSDALRLETARFGIEAVVVEPGSIRTDWGDIAARKLRETSGSGAYSEQAEAMATTLSQSSRPDAARTSSPAAVAATVLRAATVRRPRTRYRVGYGAAPMIALASLLPDRAFDRLILGLSRVPS
ncbi:oxidoreductase [Leifsonia sp. AG29]|uniref:oxidoreductase n=1 Tax=Leifsonia sp. AG29 TaxID=2598860 RepID=UPI00131A6C8C|nr:oxidoreductase [Leifsonia sp. AG29]